MSLLTNQLVLFTHRCPTNRNHTVSLRKVEAQMSSPGSSPSLHSTSKKKVMVEGDPDVTTDGQRSGAGESLRVKALRQASMSHRVSTGTLGLVHSSSTSSLARDFSAVAHSNNGEQPAGLSGTISQSPSFAKYVYRSTQGESNPNSSPRNREQLSMTGSRGGSSRRGSMARISLGGDPAMQRPSRYVTRS